MCFNCKRFQIRNNTRLRGRVDGPMSSKYLFVTYSFGWKDPSLPPKTQIKFFGRFEYEAPGDPWSVVVPRQRSNGLVHQEVWPVKVGPWTNVFSTLRETGSSTGTRLHNDLPFLEFKVRCSAVPSSQTMYLKVNVRGDLSIPETPSSSGHEEILGSNSIIVSPIVKGLKVSLRHV